MESTEFYLNPFLQNFRVITIMKSSLLKQEHKRKKFTLKYICKIFREIDWKYNLVPRPPQLFSRNFWDECILPFFVILILLTILHFAQKFCQINQKLFSTYLWFHVKIERSKKWTMNTSYTVWKLRKSNATIFLQKFCQTNLFTKALYSTLIWRKKCMAENLTFFHTVSYVVCTFTE